MPKCDHDWDLLTNTCKDCGVSYCQYVDGLKGAAKASGHTLECSLRKRIDELQHQLQELRAFYGKREHYVEQDSPVVISEGARTYTSRAPAVLLDGGKRAREAG